MLNCDKFKSISLKLVTKQGCPLFPYLFNKIIDRLLTAIRKLKEVEGYKLERERSQSIVFARMIQWYT